MHDAQSRPCYPIYISTMLEWAFDVEGEHEKGQAKNREAFRHLPEMYLVRNAKPYFLDGALKNDSSLDSFAQSGYSTYAYDYVAGSFRHLPVLARFKSPLGSLRRGQGQRTHRDASRRAYILLDMHDSGRRVEVVARKRRASRF
ncbi:hypothetical protein BDN71DRAFT_1458158 [Pleurotus eryngii]|uniref:Uncharacterized protein n=1 Tax=Pleurotus eryngii TaxID=5323 RepID=A0A9P6D9J5_PLEER|nr:hypothetical protein BDN71DRAFT_1458158 [Pleurotus eryngii]